MRVSKRPIETISLCIISRRLRVRGSSKMNITVSTNLSLTFKLARRRRKRKIKMPLISKNRINWSIKKRLISRNLSLMIWIVSLLKDWTKSRRNVKKRSQSLPISRVPLESSILKRRKSIWSRSKTRSWTLLDTEEYNQLTSVCWLRNCLRRTKDKDLLPVKEIRWYLIREIMVSILSNLFACQTKYTLRVLLHLRKTIRITKILCKEKVKKMNKSDQV